MEVNLKSGLTSQKLFSHVDKPNIQRSTFNRSHFWSGTFDAGKLIPIFCDDVLPGDTLELDLSCMIRYNTLIKPIQASQYCDFHFFFVPNRLVWDNFKRFMGEQDNPTDSIDYTFPIIAAPLDRDWET